MSILAAIDYETFMFGPFELWGPLKIHSFGLFVAIGLLTTFTLASRRGERKLGIHPEDIQNFGMWVVAFGWVFAHVFNVLFYEPEKVMEDPLILLKIWGSISSYGGLMGGIIGAWAYKWRHPDTDLLKYCDLGAWSLTFSWFFGRVGCASVHDHPGMPVTELGLPADFFLGIRFPDGIVRFDLGLYEAIWWFFICAAVLILGRKPRPRGFYLALVPTLYAPARFALDFLRLGPDAGGDIRYFGMTPAQYMSIGIFLVGIYFWRRVMKGEPEEWKQYDPKEDPRRKSSHG